MGTPFRELEAAALAAMTPDERARFDAALEEEEARLQAAEQLRGKKRTEPRGSLPRAGKTG